MAKKSQKCATPLPASSKEHQQPTSEEGGTKKYEGPHCTTETGKTERELKNKQNALHFGAFCLELITMSYS